MAQVEDGGAADDAGLQPGDIIEEVGGKPVASAAAFARVSRSISALRRSVGSGCFLRSSSA